ncbi:hypothetical protein JCM1840_003743 [Sporobolomyces johnsonii]
MSRPFSPDSSASLSDSPSSSSQKRICRSLVVAAEAHAEGVRSTLYCKVALPASSSSIPPFHLLDLTPLSRLTEHAVYSLPLQHYSSLKSPHDALEAARVLRVPEDELRGDAVQEGRTVVTTGGRRKSLVGGGGSREGAGSAGREAAIVVEEEVVSLVLADETTNGDVAALSGLSYTQTPARAGAMSTTDAGGNGGTFEYIVVLKLETTFGGLQLPSFANSITLPVPLCLRNTLSFTLPPPPAVSPSSSSWDLSVRPSLSNAQSNAIPNPEPVASSTRISGSFPSTSTLSLRWIPQAAPDGPGAPLVIKKTSVDVRWMISGLGWGRADVHVRGTFEYAGLRDKHWVDIAVGFGEEREAGDGTANGVFEVLEAEGEGVLGWEIARGNAAPSPSTSPAPSSTGLPTPPLLSHLSSVLDDFSSPLDDSLLSLSSSTSTISPNTPTPVPRLRRRPSSARPLEPRPPSFTSLFDTAPPAPPDLEASLIAEIQERGEQGVTQPSLLRQAAPFDPEASAMDMSFEIGVLARNGSGSQEAQAPPSAEAQGQSTNPSVASAATIRRSSSSVLIRVQLSLSSLLQPSRLPDPSFTFHLALEFPAITLHALHAASSLRLALPTFSLMLAEEEETLVSVSAGEAGKTAKVELLPSSAMDLLDGDNGSPASPLPAIDGTARWSTVRSVGDAEGSRRSRNRSERVEVEVSLPFTSPVEVQAEEKSLSTAMPAPSPPIPTDATPRRRRVKPKTTPEPLLLNDDTVPDVFAQQPPLSPQPSLPLVKLELTPVPPSNLHSTWRIFHQLTLPRASVLSFSLSLSLGSTVEICEAWDVLGRFIKVESVLSPPLHEAGSGTMRVDAERPVQEVLYVESAEVDEYGDVVVGRVLPQFEARVARLEVDVRHASGERFQSSLLLVLLLTVDLLPRGYEINVVEHDFDTAGRAASSSYVLSRFLVPPSACALLGLRLTSPQRTLTEQSEGELDPELESPAATPSDPVPLRPRSLAVPILFAILALFATAGISTSSFFSAPSGLVANLTFPSAATPTSSLPLSLAPAAPSVRTITSYSTLTTTTTHTHTHTHTETSRSTLATTSTVVSTTTHLATVTQYLPPEPSQQPLPVAPSPPPPVVSPLPSSVSSSVAADTGGDGHVGLAFIIWLRRLQLDANTFLSDLLGLLGL